MYLAKRDEILNIMDTLSGRFYFGSADTARYRGGWDGLQGEGGFWRNVL